METIKQIADELGVPKQRVYRFIKRNHVKEADQKHDTKYYDEAAENKISRYFADNTTSGEAHHDADEAHHDADEVHHEVVSDTVIDAVISMLQIN